MSKTKFQFVLSAEDSDLKSGWFQSLTPLQNAFKNAVDIMREKERGIKWHTFCRQCEGAQEWAKEHGYAVGRHEAGLRIWNDWAIRFHSSVYEGKPCCYIVWSGYEYIWTQ